MHLLNHHKKQSDLDLSEHHKHFYKFYHLLIVPVSKLNLTYDYHLRPTTIFETSLMLHLMQEQTSSIWILMLPENEDLTNHQSQLD